MLSLNKSSKLKIASLAGWAVIIIAFSFLPVLTNDWVNWDDEYVIENTVVQNLSFHSLRKILPLILPGIISP
jgi:hypothetical protein